MPQAFAFSRIAARMPRQFRSEIVGVEALRKGERIVKRIQKRAWVPIGPALAGRP
jgi:hypothetical protein